MLGDGMEESRRSTPQFGEVVTGLVDAAVRLVIESDAIHWCALVQADDRGGWRVVRGEGTGAPPVGTQWAEDELHRRLEAPSGESFSAEVDEQLFFEPVNAHPSGRAALVYARRSGSRDAPRGAIHDSLRHLFAHIRAVAAEGPGSIQGTDVDPISGVMTEAAAIKRLEVEVARATRYGGTTSALLVDTGSEGEMAGAETVAATALEAAGAALRRHLRQMDSAGRYGACGFLVILPETGAEESIAAGHRLGGLIREALDRDAHLRQETAGIPEGRKSAPLTIRATTFPTGARTFDELLGQLRAAWSEMHRSPDGGSRVRHQVPMAARAGGPRYHCICRRCGVVFEVDDRAHQRARRFCSHACYVEARREREQDRDTTIRALREAGQSLRAIAQRYGLSPERVRQICLSQEM